MSITETTSVTVSPVAGPGEEKTALSLKAIWNKLESTAGMPVIHPCYGARSTAKCSGAMTGRENCRLSNFFQSPRQFKFVVPTEVWGFAAEEVENDDSIEQARTVYCDCAEKAIMLCTVAAMGTR